MAGVHKRGIHLAELKKANLQNRLKLRLQDLTENMYEKPFMRFRLKYSKIKTRSGTQKPGERETKPCT